MPKSSGAPIGRPWQALALSCVLTLLVTTLTFAQSGGAPSLDPAVDSPPASVVTRDATGKVVVHATRITQPPDIDGRLDDAVYNEVPAMTEFIQQEPTEGAPITEKTEVWVMFDDQNIYVACRCGDQHPERIVANDMRRDGSNQPLHDQFSVTVRHVPRSAKRLPVRRDGHRRAAGMAPSPTSARTSTGTALGRQDDEIRSGLDRGDAHPVQDAALHGRAGANLGHPAPPVHGRQERTSAYHTNVASRRDTAIFFMSQAATLVGLEAPPPALNFEIKPYGVSRVTTDQLSNPAVRNDLTGDAGIDVKYGVTKSLTLDATYNTDFAQVEADEAQVNLTRFSLSLPEKREFFLEGAGIFAFGSQAGGGASGGDAPTIFYSRRIGLSGSRAVPVIGGARFTGTAGLWNIGAFNMETDDDARRRRSEDELHRRAAAAQHSATEHRWRHLHAPVAFNRRAGRQRRLGSRHQHGLLSQRVLRRLLRTVAHGRPRERRPELPGQFSYAGDRYGLGLDRMVVGTHFNPEVGFLRREDFRQNVVQARFSPRTMNNPLVRRWVYQGNFEYTTDNENHLESRELSGSFETEFHSGNSFTAQYLRLYEFLPAPFLISPGVRIPAGGYSFDNARLVFVSGVQNRVTGTSALEIGSFYSGDKKTATFSGRVEMTPQFGIEPSISLNWVDLPEGEFTNTILGGRVTYTMSPQMFVASLVQYSSSNTSLLTNVRFRWEYQPGSEFFVVYTEGRTTLPPRGTDLQNRGLVIKINRLLRF